MTKHLSHSQVIPYLQGLSASGVSVTVLSFEERFEDPQEEAAEMDRVRELMSGSKIGWKSLRYHKRPSLPATAYDVAIGTILAIWLVVRHRIDVVHSRAYVPLPIALMCKWLCGTKLVFDVRGLMAEEYVDAGSWKEGSVAFRITKWFERRAFRNADAVIVLTERIRTILQSKSKELRAGGAPVHVIPCCVELEPYKTLVNRQAARDRLRLSGNPVLAYVGSLGTWYMGEEMVKLFKELLRVRPQASFLLLTQSPEAARELFARQQVPQDRYKALTVKPEEVPEYLSVADCAVTFIKPCYSKVASSPTKIGEYLAAGLPFLTNRGIGDLDELVERNQIGVLVDAFDEKSYAGAVKSILQMLEHEEGAPARCRRLAESEFSMRDVGWERYVNVYKGLRESGIDAG